MKSRTLQSDTNRALTARIGVSKTGSQTMRGRFMFLPPELVIFDCDGVLVDSEPITNGVIRDSLSEHGLKLELDEIMRLFVGGTMDGVFSLAREMGARLQDDWVERIYQEIFVTLADQVEPVPGAITVLDALDTAGIPYAIGSNGPHAKMDVTLARCGLQRRLQGRVFSRQDVEHPKPAPDVYLHAARKVGIAPSRCVVIEDSVSGAKAGVAAGMTTLGFCRETPRDGLSVVCDAVFEDMATLPELLGLR